MPRLRPLIIRGTFHLLGSSNTWEGVGGGGLGGGGGGGGGRKWRITRQAGPSRRASTTGPRLCRLARLHTLVQVSVLITEGGLGALTADLDYLDVASTASAGRLSPGPLAVLTLAVILRI